MSKARLVITAVIVEKRPVSEVVADYGVSKSWVYELLARYHEEGEAAFEPRSRRPKTSPSATPTVTVELILRFRKELTEQGLDAGPDTIPWHLKHHHAVDVSRSMVSRQLTAHGLVTPQPKKRPKSSDLQFAAALPNESWQSDFTHYRLTGTDGCPDVEILCWLDDCSRYALSVTAHLRVTGSVVLAAFRATTEQYGIPAATLTDIQSGWRGIRADLSANGDDRCRPAPARHRYLTEWSALRLLAC